MEKAYKLLAIAKNISNAKAKELIDKGLVSVNGARLKIARGEISKNSKFEILEVKEPKIIFQDENILALDKPPFIESYDLASRYKDWTLLHRLDKETSGVILLVHEDSEFAKKAKSEFKNQKVYKEYRAIVYGTIAESGEIALNLNVSKGKYAKTTIDKHGLPAITKYSPLEIQGKKTMLKVVIPTGRTHQIRVHLKALGFGVVGDTFYGERLQNAKRLMLHAYKISLLGYEFTSEIPKDFRF